MTLWPGVPLPLPPLIPRRALYRLHESGAVVIGTGGWPAISTDDRLGEIYLQLYALDLDDPTAIIAFANRYGTPSGALVHHALGHSSWFSPLFSPDEDRYVRDAVFESDPALRARSEDVTHPGWELTEITTLESIRFAARVLADLTDAWRIVNVDPLLDVSSHEWRLNYPPHANVGDTRFFAFALLTTALTALLARFHPYVRGVQPPVDSEPEEPELAAEGAGVEPMAGRSIPFAHLAEFCALELFNHIAASEVYRQCENESCGRIFVRHPGGAEGRELELAMAPDDLPRRD